MGIGNLMAKDEGAPVRKIFESGSVVMQKITMVVMELTPFGVFALMAWVAGTLGLDALAALGKLVFLNYLGCLLIILVMYSALIKFIARLPVGGFFRSEEQTSELQSLMRISYAVFCLKKKKKHTT